jgi:hypothetical protein
MLGSALAYCDAFLLVVFRIVLFSFWKHLHPANFQRAIVFVQSRVHRDVVPLMSSYWFRVQDAVSLLVFVILQYMVAAIFPNPSGYARLSDSVA